MSRKVLMLCVVGSLCSVHATTDLTHLRVAYRQVPSLWPTPTIDEGVAWQELSALPMHNRALAPLTLNTRWEDTENSAIVSLGERLFKDKRLSRKQTTACVTCHQPARSFTDGRPLAIGEDGLMGTRRSMPLFGAATAEALFWDGRAASLFEQVLQPIRNPKEMNFAPELVLERFDETDDYAFLDAFNTVPNVEVLARALSAYVASLRPPHTRFDQFLETLDTDILTDAEIQGLHLFRTKARCMNCHFGPLLTDQAFHNTGLSFAGRRHQDLGRYEITRLANDVGTFRTPSLRGVSSAGPWMHNGIFPSLKGVVKMYASGMTSVVNAESLPFAVHTSPLIQPLELSDTEIEAILAFLAML